MIVEGDALDDGLSLRPGAGGDGTRVVHPCGGLFEDRFLAAGAFATAALARFYSLHNETFDLAFYTRWVWGLGNGDRYQPLTNSNFVVPGNLIEPAHYDSRCVGSNPSRGQTGPVP